MNRRQLIRVLETDLKLKIRGFSEDFNGSKNGIWVSAESNKTHLNYYNGSFNFGVSPELADKLESCGWVPEFYDAGTVLIFPS